MVPSYYLRYFYAHDAVVARAADARRPGPSQVAAIEEKLLAMYADPALDEKPALLAERGGAFYSEAAVDLVGVPAAGPAATCRSSTSATTAPCRSCPTTR